MTLQAPMRCSALAEQLEEPLAGTVDVRPRWLLIEDRSAWGTEAVADVIGADAATRAKALRLRVLLVRRREGDPAADATRRATLVDTVTREMAVREISDPSALSVDELVAQPIADFGAPLPGPLFLVCTNGKRDACCALRGRALVAVLAEEPDISVLECTHLGGHRFAPNLVCLPDGILYGRVPPAEGPRLVRGYAAGRLEPSLLRGRSAWPAPAQVAEIVLRNRLGLEGVDEVRLLSAEIDGASAVVVLSAANEEHTFTLVQEAAEPARPTSCRADELERPLHWRLVDS